MVMTDFLFRKSADRREAERDLRKSEDELMAVDERELQECPVHAAADHRRQGVILARQRVTQTAVKELSDRNLMATVVAAAVIVAVIKGGPVAAVILKALGF